MQNDPVAKALAEVAASRAWREKRAEQRAKLLEKVQASSRPLYILKSKKQLQLQLQ